MMRNPPPPTQPEQEVIQAEISLEDALAEMYSLMGELYGPETRAGSRAVANVATIKKPGTRAGESAEVRAYVVNFDEGGFAVLGAVNELPSVICITEAGAFTEREILHLSDNDTSASGDTPQWMSYQDIHASIGTDSGSPEPFVYSDYCMDWDPDDIQEEDLGDYLVYARDDSFVKEMLYAFVDDDRSIVGGGSGPTYTYTYTYDPWVSSSSGKIGPLLITKWDQATPFENWCYAGSVNHYHIALSGSLFIAPRFDKYQRAGCVPIALAQIIAYNQTVPPSAYHKDIKSTWAEIKEHNYYTGSNIPDHQRIRNDLAFIIRRIGYNVGMDYDVDGSTATIGAAKRYLKNRPGYSNVKKKKYKIGHINDMLAKKLPVYIRGQKNVKGHAWVIDGSVTQSCKVDEYLTNGVYHLSYNLYRFMFHCNFGWGGTADGYYYSGIFNPKVGPVDSEPGVDLDIPGTNSKADLFDNKMQIIIYNK